MSCKNVIVIGASAGGIKALKSLLEDIPRDFPAPIFIVMHTQATSHLPDLLNKSIKLKATYPKDGQKIQKGCIYIAPPNLHMIIFKNKIYLRHGPKINYSRPAIDPLFYSAAVTYGSSVIGIVLSGMLQDGTTGLLAIKKNNGITIIQDLAEAEYKEMPGNALKNVPIDYCLTIKDIASKLIEIITR